MVTLTEAELARLSPGLYLNDNIIDFYLSWLMKEVIPHANREHVHVFSTHFFTQLSQSGGVETVAAWTKKKVQEIDAHYYAHFFHLARILHASLL